MVFTVPTMFTRMVEVGLLRTVSMPAMAARWMMRFGSLPRMASRTRAASSTSPRMMVRLGCAANGREESESRANESNTHTLLSSMSCPISVAPMNPAPPVRKIRLPFSTRSG